MGTKPVFGPGPHALLCDGRRVAALAVADTTATRRRGLLGTSAVDGALWITRCPSVHMVGMRYPIDVAVVDRAVARIIAHESGGRVLAVAEAKIIEADPTLHQERAEAERRRRYVSSSRTDEFGLRTVIARVEAGDAVWVEATVARVAEIIAPLHPDAAPGELRSVGHPDRRVAEAGKFGLTEIVGPRESGARLEAPTLRAALRAALGPARDAAGGVPDPELSTRRQTFSSPV